MTGEHDIDFLQAYADGELDPAAMAEFEKKLAADPKLRAKYESILSLRRLIRTVPDDDIPAERLRSKAVSAISQRPTQRRNSWRALAAAALVGAVLSGGGTFIGLQQFASRQEVTRFAVSNHIRSLLAEKPYDIASSDRHTVKPWFTTKLPESPPVVDLAASGFALVGGRVDVVAGEPVASMVYRRGPHAISVTALRGARNIKGGDIAGYNVDTWHDDHFTYVAVSDISPETLDAFRRAFITGASAKD
jgi:anti-sigma factor RsiW